MKQLVEKLLMCWTNTYVKLTEDGTFVHVGSLVPTTDCRDGRAQGHRHEKEQQR